MQIKGQVRLWKESKLYSLSKGHRQKAKLELKKESKQTWGTHILKCIDGGTSQDIKKLEQVRNTYSLQSIEEGQVRTWKEFKQARDTRPLESKDRGIGQNIKESKQVTTYSLKSANGGISQDVKRIWASRGHSHSKEHRQKNKLEQGKNLRVRSTHKLKCSQRDKLGLEKDLSKQGTLTL